MLESQSICESNAQVTFYDNSLKASFNNILENVEKSQYILSLTKLQVTSLLVQKSSWIHMHSVYTNLMTAKKQKPLNDVTSALKSLKPILGL